ncbi:glutamine amidotransferase-like class 1 domain-containing protein 1 [Watersipora subatra]|uniref:glutamine amidotransferase-like class 1 domain-containing protein 1 n=1 Tax=Watersipora subatra TaxID=2589382 RepID=UPI00355BA536
MATHTAASASKKNCLLVVSSAPQGVSSQSFVQTYTILHQAQLQIQLASPGGADSELVNQDDATRKWIADFKSKSYSHPIALESVDASRYSAVVIPHAPGAIFDLAKHKSMAEILSSFIKEDKLICAIGQGCAALCSARSAQQAWQFKNRCITSMSVYELARQEDFSSMPLIVEDFAKDNGAIHSVAAADGLHVCIDGNIITGQNEYSTLTAVQNLVLLVNQTRSRGAVNSR